jgi:hypothetical protein
MTQALLLLPLSALKSTLQPTMKTENLSGNPTSRDW